MEAKRSCLKCVCFLVCSKISTDYQMRKKWNGNKNNGHKRSEEFFEFMASKCESFHKGKKIIEQRDRFEHRKWQ